MKIDTNRCTLCGECAVYCPVGAIRVLKTRVEIDQQACVECGVCHKSGICEAGAIYQETLEWPRVLRAHFSDPLVYHPVTQICGRGTTEVKTNDVSNRIDFGEVGIVIEVGRPNISTDFKNIELIVRTLLGKVQFAEQNPLMSLIDEQTGRFKDRAVLNERVLSAIIECKVKETDLYSVLKELESIEDDLETVFSLGVISRCRDFEMPVYEELRARGYDVKVNGKINLGLGRPLK